MNKIDQRAFRDFIRQNATDEEYARLDNSGVAKAEKRQILDAVKARILKRIAAEVIRFRTLVEEHAQAAAAVHARKEALMAAPLSDAREQQLEELTREYLALKEQGRQQRLDDPAAREERFAQYAREAQEVRRWIQS